MGVRYYKETAGVTLLTLVVVTAYSFWGAHVLKDQASSGAVSQAVVVGS
jgi:uncharacterized protein (UPF0333 family)